MLGRNNSVEKYILPYIDREPSVTYYPDYNPHSASCKETDDWAHIRALTYDGADSGENKTKVFAYIGFPDRASAENKVPAIVLVHGGGGHAFAEWIKIWTDQGYAAIAMDTTGYFPSDTGRGVAGRELDNVSWWHHGLYGPFIDTEYTDAPNLDELNSSSDPIEKQWMYHAIVATIGAHNILLNDERVDTGRIGITGISWGGVITSLAIGYDTRYAFAIPIYGCGYLDECRVISRAGFKEPETKALWSASDRFNRVTFPVLWLCYANDVAFSINSNSHSYMETRKQGAQLSIKRHWDHSHAHGWKAEESYLFADSVVKGMAPLTRVLIEPEGYIVRLPLQPHAEAVAISARIVYISECLSYSCKNAQPYGSIDQIWKTTDCVVDDNIVIGQVPKEARGYYVEVTTQTLKSSYLITTALIEFND